VDLKSSSTFPIAFPSACRADCAEAFFVGEVMHHRWRLIVGRDS
jgi:hypothetical protein